MVLQWVFYVRKANFLLIVIFFIFNWCMAQDLEPRVYANLPKGGNIIVGSYGFMKGDVVSEPTLPCKSYQETFQICLNIGNTRASDLKDLN